MMRARRARCAGVSLSYVDGLGLGRAWATGTASRWNGFYRKLAPVLPESAGFTRCSALATERERVLVSTLLRCEEPGRDDRCDRGARSARELRAWLGRARRAAG